MSDSVSKIIIVLRYLIGFLKFSMNFKSQLIQLENINNFNTVMDSSFYLRYTDELCAALLKVNPSIEFVVNIYEETHLILIQIVIFAYL